MIQDKASLKNVRDSWKTVRVVDAQIATNMNAGIFSLVPTATGFSVVPESLLLVFAVAVLEEVLVELEDQGTFYSRKGLKRLMEEIMSTHTGQPIEKVQKDMDRDYYMTSQEAQEYGVIDAVVRSRDSARAAVAA